MQEQNLDKVICKQMHKNNVKIEVMAFSSCLSSGDSPEFMKAKTLCEGYNEIDPKIDIVRMIPLVQNELVFSNIYCAICSEMATWADLESLADSVITRCTGSDMISYTSSETPEEYYAQIKSNCSFEPKSTPTGEKIRLCSHKYYRLPYNSNYGESSSDNLARCLSYSGRVAFGNEIYPNVHCAVLDGRDPGSANCCDSMTEYEMTRPRLVTFAMLLDLHRSARPPILLEPLSGS